MPTQPDGRVAQQLRMEAAFWENDPHERPGSDSIENILNKSVDATIFRDIVARHAAQFATASRIVEVGGGQGWASCVVKRLHPAAHVTLTDGIAAAVAGRAIWERVFNCRLDAAVAAPAQAIDLPDGSVDLLFCFAAAHHFVDHDAALAEVRRLLSADGHCLWLYEPTCTTLLHAAAERRVNRKRPDVKEHVLRPDLLAAQAARAGLTMELEYWPSTLRRGRFENLYYLVLSFMPALARLLPCTANILFRRAR